MYNISGAGIFIRNVQSQYLTLLKGRAMHSVTGKTMTQNPSYEKTKPIPSLRTMNYQLQTTLQNKPNYRVAQSRTNLLRSAHPHEKLVHQKHKKFQKIRKKHPVFKRYFYKTNSISENTGGNLKKQTQFPVYEL